MEGANSWGEPGRHSYADPSSARLCLKMISERRDVLHAFLYPSKIRAERVMRGGYFEERLFVEPTMYRHPQLDCDNGTGTSRSELLRSPSKPMGSLSFLEIDVYGASTDGQLQIGDRDRTGGRSACRRVRHERGRAVGDGPLGSGEPLVPYTTNTSYQCFHRLLP